MSLDNDSAGQPKDLRDHLSPIRLFEVNVNVCSSRRNHDGKTIAFGSNTKTQKHATGPKDVVGMNEIRFEVSYLLDKLTITQSLGRQHSDSEPSIRKSLTPPLYCDGIACHRGKSGRAEN
jgi:hypothetical protein